MMVKNDSYAERLREMVKRAGYSHDAFAKAAGYAGQSSVQRRLDLQREDEPYPLDFIQAITPVLVGRGKPAITQDEVFALSGANLAQIPLNRSGNPVWRGRRWREIITGLIEAELEKAGISIPDSAILSLSSRILAAIERIEGGASLDDIARELAANSREVDHVAERVG